VGRASIGKNQKGNRGFIVSTPMKRAFGLALLTMVAFPLNSVAVDFPSNDCAEQQEFCTAIGYGDVRCVSFRSTFFGNGPFPCSQACREGTRFDPLECELHPDDIVDEPDNQTGTVDWPCRGEADCPYEVVGVYQTCGGIVWPLMVDDNDNIYFWTARGRLHSIDRNGEFRWLFELCAPAPDWFASNPEMRQNFPSVMDYYGDIFFIVGDELYAVGANGEVLLQRRIRIPGIRPEPTEKIETPFVVPETLLFQDGDKNQGDQAVWRSAGEPVITTDGRLFAIFELIEGIWRQRRQGVVELSRAGEVLNTYLPWDDQNKDQIITGLTGDPQERIVFEMISMQNSAFSTCSSEWQGEPDYTGYSVTSENGEMSFSAPWTWGQIGEEVGHIVLFSPDFTNQTAFAVASDGSKYGPSNWFRLSRVAANDPLEFYFSMFRDDYLYTNFNPFTRPVISADDTIYLEQDLSPGYLWAIDSNALGTPLPAESATVPNVSLTTPGVKWRWDAGSYAGGIAGTPAIAENGNVYFTAGTHITALDPDGNEVWDHTSPTGVFPGMTTILSDGTLVITGQAGHVFLLKEKYIDNGGLAQSGWPRAFHDNYHSNNAAHPIRWDRSGPAPYPRVTELLADKPADWSCSQDDRCYPSDYYYTCDWGGTYDWAGHEVAPDSPGAVCTPCPDPRRTPCTVTGLVPEEESCDGGSDGGADGSPSATASAGCSCATVGGNSRKGFSLFSLL
jgi:hypothetical protein